MGNVSPKSLNHVKNEICDGEIGAGAPKDELKKPEQP
jgi:hypothetical protein